MSETAVVWIHHGIRVDDHPALAHAARSFRRVRAVYSYSDDVHGAWEPGAAQRWWIHEHLLRLGRALADRGIDLHVTTDSPAKAILAGNGDGNGGGNGTGDGSGSRSGTGPRPRAVFWNEPLTPAARRAGRSLAASLESAGVEIRVFEGDLLHDPDEIRTQEGHPYRVFTPFYKSFLDAGPPAPPVGMPAAGPGGKTRTPVAFDPKSVERLGLVDEHPWINKLRNTWEPGERAAGERLESFLAEDIRSYHDRRNIPAERATSRLSPYLAVGAIGPRRIWYRTIRMAMDAVVAAGPAFPSARSHAGTDAPGIAGWLREVGWREFAWHLLIHYPETPESPLREKWNDFPWSMDEAAFETWKAGRTGYPIVDAGMRELTGSGWMHNRVRMIVASFLTKDLMIPWQAGARWFWDRLIDADLANNTLGWQWAAGSGADAQPFFRIFNPASQSRKFDPDGAYIRRWVEELRGVDGAGLHDPLEGDVLRNISGYPEPMVDHAQARKAALAAWERFRD